MECMPVQSKEEAKNASGCFFPGNLPAIAPKSVTLFRNTPHCVSARCCTPDNVHVGVDNAEPESACGPQMAISSAASVPPSNED